MRRRVKKQTTPEVDAEVVKVQASTRYGRFGESDRSDASDPYAMQGVKLQVTAVARPSRLVTLEDPASPPTLAQDAFARLRPPEGSPPDVVASWRDSVAQVARAVRVLPTRFDASVPLASERNDDRAEVGSFREEALALARETNAPEVVDLVALICDTNGAT